jgi:hypothetical protein
MFIEKNCKSYYGGWSFFVGTGTEKEEKEEASEPFRK